MLMLSGCCGFGHATMELLMRLKLPTFEGFVFASFWAVTSLLLLLFFSGSGVGGPNKDVRMLILFLVEAVGANLGAVSWLLVLADGGFGEMNKEVMSLWVLVVVASPRAGMAESVSDCFLGRFMLMLPFLSAGDRGLGFANMEAMRFMLPPTRALVASWPAAAAPSGWLKIFFLDLNLRQANWMFTAAHMRQLGE